jgi:O2-independent ubiquinone biosynthesis accessory factor UbiT
MSFSSLLRFLPPPRRWALPMRLVPRRMLAQVFERAAATVLADALERGELLALEGRVLGIDVLDLGLRFAVRVNAGHVRIASSDEGDAAIEARVQGTLTDLLLLASRLEDADTLFFQRRLGLTGDTELGLTARNLLDQLDWAQVPLPLRIVLNRAARFADWARASSRSSREIDG